MNPVHSVIYSFFDSLTAEQWQHIAVGCLNDATRTLLLELVVDIVSCVTDVSGLLLRKLPKIVSEETVKDSLGDTLVQPFAMVLGIPAQSMPSEDVEKLKHLVSEEVAASLRSTPASADVPHTLHITTPDRLKVMLKTLHSMLKGCMENLDTPKKKGKKDRKRTASQQRIAEDKLWSQSSSISPNQKAAQDIIKKNITDITKPLLDDVSNVPYELSSRDHQWLFGDESTLDRTRITGPDSKLRRRIKKFLTMHRARALLLRMVEKVRKVFELISDSEGASRSSRSSSEGASGSSKSAESGSNLSESASNSSASNSFESGSESSKSSKASLECIVKRTDSLFKNEDGDAQEDGRLVQVLSGKDTDFTEELCNLIYGHLTGEAEKSPEQEVKAHAYVCNEISKRVKCFLSLLNWWYTTEADKYSESVTLALIGPPPSQQGPTLTPTQAGEREAAREEAQVSRPEQEKTAPLEETAKTFPAENYPEDNDVSYTEENEISYQILIKNLVTLTMKTCKINRGGDLENRISASLFQNTWPYVGDVNFLGLTPKTYGDLDKVVFKDLCEKWGSADKLLLAMRLESMPLETDMASSFREHAVNCAEGGAGAISCFLNAVRNTISKVVRCFKKRNKVDVAFCSAPVGGGVTWTWR